MFSSLIVGEGVLEGQACCRKFGPAARSSFGASTHPAASASLGIVLAEAGPAAALNTRRDGGCWPRRHTQNNTGSHDARRRRQGHATPKHDYEASWKHPTVATHFSAAAGRLSAGVTAVCQVMNPGPSGVVPNSLSKAPPFHQTSLDMIIS